MTRARALDIAHTILCLGLNKLIAYYGVDPRWRYAVWALVAANEARGLAVVYQFGGAALRAAT